MSATALTALSDADLLDWVRRGEESAFTELYARHREVAHRMAAVYARSGEADDLVDVAFEKVLGALRRGSGPSGAFRAYLFVTLRRLAAEQAERPRERSLEALPEPVAQVAAEPGLDPSEREMITSAFDSLPDRWQAVLWHTAVEGQHPRDLASVLGMSANAVSALAYRAREKLRQAYLQAHLQVAPRPQCEPHRSCLGAYVRDGQSARERRATNAHLDHCGSCQALVTELRDVNRLLARSVLPFFLVGSARGLGSALTGAVGAGEIGADTARRSLRSWARLHHVGSVIGGIAATTALVVGVIEARPHFRAEDPVRTDATGTALGADDPIVDEASLDAAPTSNVTPCPVAGEAAAGDPGAAATSAVTTATTALTGLGGLLAPVVGLLAPPTTVPAQSPVNLTGVVCTPGDPGHSDLSVSVAGAEIAAVDVDEEAPAVDLEVDGALPVAAEVTVDLSDGARIALDVGLPAGCEMTEDRKGLTCVVNTLVPGVPTQIVGLDVEALQGGNPTATVTVKTDNQTVVSQTLDLTAVTGLLGSP